MAESLIDVLRRREVVTTDPAEARQCCGMDRDEDGFCRHRPSHPIYVEPVDDAAVVAAVTALADEWEQSLPELYALADLSYANCTAMDLRALRALLPAPTVTT